MKYTNSKGKTYYLHSRNVTLRGNRQQVIYYFAKLRGTEALDELPAGYKIVESDRTGLPILKKA